jgi:hypothetical protein
MFPLSRPEKRQTKRQQPLSGLGIDGEEDSSVPSLKYRRRASLEQIPVPRPNPLPAKRLKDARKRA